MKREYKLDMGTGRFIAASEQNGICYFYDEDDVQSVMVKTSELRELLKDLERIEELKNAEN